MTKFTIEDLRDIAYRGSYDDLERELALQLLSSIEQAPVYLRPFGDDGETFVACDGNDERAITLYAAPQLPQPAVPDMAAVGEMPFLGTQENAFVSGWNACRAAMLQSFGNSEQLNSPVIPDGWVACVERMPSAGEQVLAYRQDAPESNDPLIKMATYVGGSAHGHGFDCYCKPTHWMPLPAAPQQEA